ncbi:MAG: 6-phosphofructokinase [Thermoanaerobacter sp.]|jgi:6-phosphofructokinase 1|nr:6-phosphofructokinase [Thermoanaerobacter sp.]
MRKIGVLTSGGDSPGMNACIAGLVKKCYENGIEIVGVKNGYRGFLDKDYVKLDMNAIEGISKRGGTILRTARLPELKELSVQKQIAEEIKVQNMDAIVVLGGDGSLRGANDLSKLGINVIGIPCTIDNNVYGSEYTIGYDTAQNKTLQVINDIEDTADAMPGRVFLVETLGAEYGFLAYAAYQAGAADMFLVPEIPFEEEKICKNIKDILEKKKKYVIITICEGLGRTYEISKKIEKELGIHVRITIIGHQQRGGTPSAYERIQAVAFAEMAIDAVLKGTSNKIIVYRNGKHLMTDFFEVSMRKDLSTTNVTYR